MEKALKSRHYFVIQSGSTVNFPATERQMLLPLYKKVIIVLRRLRYPGARNYWERRYAGGGDSGAGSVGRLAVYKAETVNRFVREHDIQSVAEFGCGDGRQLRLAEYPFYIGLDVSKSAVERCRALFAGDHSRRFEIYQPEFFSPLEFQSDMALSLEVIFHLTEYDTYNLYIRHLFATARHWVVIFSSDKSDATGGVFPHFRPRRFSGDVPPGWSLVERLENPHSDISISEFFFFEKNAPEDRGDGIEHG